MLKQDVEYTFSILNYKLKNGVVSSFTYYISMYYRDGIKPGYHQETSEYTILEQNISPFTCIDEVVEYILKTEKISNIEQSSIFTSCSNGLEINSIDCSGEGWFLSNVRK